MKIVYKVILTIIALTVAGGYFLSKKSYDPQRMAGISPRTGEISPSTEFLNADRAVEYYRNEIRRNPGIVENYVNLARLFLQEVRVTGNEAEYLPRTQSLLQEALRLDPENFDAILTKASMLLTMHQFQEAKELAQRASEKNFYSAALYGVLVDVAVERGEYDEAVKACDHMMSLRPDLRSYSRVSYLRELHGDLTGAQRAMKMAADAGVWGQENRVWSLYNLANLYLSEGKLDTATFIYKGILEERPMYAYALSGLARVSAARGNFVHAIEFTKKAYESLPSAHFQEQLAELYHITGQKREAELVIQFVLKSFENDEALGHNVDSEFALFAADNDIHLSDALNRAKRDFERRPENIHSLEAYAWALYKNGRPVEAMPLIEKAMRLHTRNAALHYRAGMIYVGAGKSDQGLACLRLALKESIASHVPFAQEARKVLSSVNAVAFNQH